MTCIVQETCSLVTMVNDVYGVHLLLSSASSFTMVVATLFRIYMGVIESRSEFMVINNLIWVLYTAQIAITCGVCTAVCHESSRVGELIHKIGIKYDSLSNINSPAFSREPEYVENLPFMHLTAQALHPDHVNSNSRSVAATLHRNNVERNNLNQFSIRREVCDFSIQMTVHRVHFTACNFFEINNSLFRGVSRLLVDFLFYLKIHQIIIITLYIHSYSLSASLRLT